jgi:hypothetical protein
MLYRAALLIGDCFVPRNDAWRERFAHSGGDERSDVGVSRYCG